MTCTRYWREGVALVERGEPDPHRDGCAECGREHAARERILRALPLIAPGRGDPDWEAEVWRRVAGPPPRRRRALVIAGLVLVVVVVVWLLLR